MDLFLDVHGEKRAGGARRVLAVGILIRQDVQMQQDRQQNADGKILDGVIL